MAKHYLVTIFISFGAVLAAEYDTKLSNKINGQRLMTNHPFIATIIERDQYGNTNSCLGTILSTQWVITSAFCIIKMKLGLIDVYFGQRLPIESDSFSTLRSVSGILIHPKYNLKNNLNNIGLVQVAQPIIYDSLVNRVNLASPKTDEEKSFFSIGFSFENIGQEVYELFNMDELSYEICLETVRKQNRKLFISEDGQICAATNDGRRDLCWKDEGAPLLMYTGKQKITIVGIFSNNYLMKNEENNCGKEEAKPYLFTKVSKFVKWINNSTGLQLSLFQ